MKPCPFCGNTEPSVAVTEDLNMHTHHVAKCFKCPAMVSWFDTRDEAVKAWNKRVGIKDDIRMVVASSIPCRVAWYAGDGSVRHGEGGDAGEKGYGMRTNEAIVLGMGLGAFLELLGLLIGFLIMRWWE